MRLPFLIVLLGLGAALVVFPVTPGRAQQPQVEIVAPPPERVRPPDLIIPGQPPDTTHPREADFRPDNIRTRHDPAFIAPFSKTVQTGPTTAIRVGLSGWTAPPGRGDLLMARETSGWFGLGLTIAWDVPVEPAKPTAPPRPAPSR